MHLLTWDHREQPSFEAIECILNAMGAPVHLTVVETQDDQYAVIFAREQVSPEEAQAMYERFLSAPQESAPRLLLAPGVLGGLAHRAELSTGPPHERKG